MNKHDADVDSDDYGGSYPHPCLCDALIFKFVDECIFDEKITFSRVPSQVLSEGMPLQGSAPTTDDMDHSYDYGSTVTLNTHQWR